MDTEVLVHLYEGARSGQGACARGMYAFAVWDARRQQLLVVRDRFGEKPLFYAQEGAELLFASELDALLMGVNQDAELDPAAVDSFFVFGYVPGPASIVRGIKQLPPGHLLRWERRSRHVRVERYWTPVKSGTPTMQQSSLDHRGVPNQLISLPDESMEPAQGVLPVVVTEAVLEVGVEQGPCRPQRRAISSAVCAVRTSATTPHPRSRRPRL